MSADESTESNDSKAVKRKVSAPLGTRLIDRGRRSYYAWLFWMAKTWHNQWHLISLGALVSLMGISAYLASTWQRDIGVLDSSQLAAVQTLLVTIGGSFIGATAIVSAMLMYSLQVNVERMPHKLFRQFSMDRQILLAFV